MVRKAKNSDLCYLPWSKGDFTHPALYPSRRIRHAFPSRGATARDALYIRTIPTFCAISTRVPNGLDRRW